MLTRVTFLKDYRKFKKGFTLEFRPGVNLLVGDNGAGKSSLLQLIRHMTSGDKFERERSIKEIKLEEDVPTQTCNYDFEKDNRRTLSYFDSDGPGGTQLQINAMFSSHGEASMGTLGSLFQKGKKLTYLFDEPDTAMSMRVCHIYSAIFKNWAEHGNQLIVAVHNPILIASQEEVLAVESGWTKSGAFMKFLTDQAMDFIYKTKPKEKKK
jgi:predicted ATPase